jgi:hypothetical protein
LVSPVIADNAPEIQTDDILAACLDKLEAATKRAINETREKHFKR